MEAGGPTKAGPWIDAENQRLKRLVSHAHRRGLWIRFYTLNGYGSGESSGWSADYNFGSREGVQLRWTAAMHAAVDFVATDQYEDFKSVEHHANLKPFRK